MSSPNTIPIAALYLAISQYFLDNPGIIVSEYDPDEAKENQLSELEKYCSTPGAWYQEDVDVDGYAPNEYNVHLFLLRNWAKLEEHGYADEDGVKIYIHENGVKILDVMVECH